MRVRLVVRIHVDIPAGSPPPAPAAPAAPVPAGAACATLAACCPTLSGMPMSQPLVTACTMVSSLKKEDGCANMLSTLRKKNFCP